MVGLRLEWAAVQAIFEWVSCWWGHIRVWCHVDHTPAHTQDLLPSIYLFFLQTIKADASPFSLVVSVKFHGGVSY